MGDPTRFSAKAGADLTAHQYTIMRLSAEDTVSVASEAAHSLNVGVLMNNPNTGEAATVQFSGVTKVMAGAAIAQGLQFTTNGSGRAAGVSSGDLSIILGRVIEAATADGDIVRCILQPAVRWPGAA